MGMRLMFGVENQVSFFRKIKRASGLSNNVLGSLVGISGRSFGDWVNGKILPSKKGVLRLCRHFKVVIPRVLEEREEYWSGRINGRKAALKRMEIYGAPGTPEGRRKGGLVTQLKRKESPEYYKKWACITRNKFNKPKKSEDLAEFIGIVLGDGGLTRGQLCITLNSKADSVYVSYVSRLIFKLFEYKPHVFKRRDANAIVIVVTGVNFVDYLLELGLKIGNKVKQQVDVPLWIKNNLRYSNKCLRGLMDTDGGIFTHKYRVEGREYSYLKLCFSNRSKPLRVFVFETLRKNGFNAKVAIDRHVWLYSNNESIFYLKIVGSSNYRLQRVIE